MKNKLLFDSNIFLSYLIKDFEFEKSQQILEHVIKKWIEIYVNQFVIEEIFTVSVYKIWLDSKSVVFSFLKDLWVNFTNTSFEDYLSFYVNKVNTKISFTDASLVYDALYYDMELVSFDKQLISFYNKLFW